MNLEMLQNYHTKTIKNCQTDNFGLSDFQKMPDESEIAIDEVGIERLRIPIRLEHDGEIMSHDALAGMKIFLQQNKTGVNMSRFCTILQKQLEEQHVDSVFFHETLLKFREQLRDDDREDLISKAILELKFNYPLKQNSLKSNNWGWQYYECLLRGEQTMEGTNITMTLQYEYSSTCPCSLAMAKQYEKDFINKKTLEGNGTAVPHAQRSVATVTITSSYEREVSIKELLSLIKEALPTETQSLVKRIDEQAFSILNGENPMFVEHATRRLSIVLDRDDRIEDWTAKVEHLESLHSHNAVAVIKKNHSRK